MDYRKINSHVILLLMVSVVGLAIAVAGRLIMLDKGFDTGTANLTFLIIIGVCVVFYLIILATLANVIVPWIMKIFPGKKRIKSTLTEKNTSDKKEIIPINPNVARQDFEKRQIEELNEKINTFFVYSHLSIALIITDEELFQLNKYIECYARKLPLPNNITPIKTKKQNNNDLMRFGWNMANFFDYEKQEVVPWLLSIFAEMQELEPSYIKGKLKHKTKNQIIPIVEDIPAYLQDLNK